MKENIEELRANFERTEMAGLKFIATRVACARAALDYISQLEQTSRAQRTNEGKCNSAAAPAAGQAGLAKLRTYDPDRDYPGVMEERDKYNDGDYYKVEDVQALFATLAAPVAAATEQATDELSDEEQAALDRLDKPEWRAASNLKLRALLAVEVANCIRMGAKIENLQDELRATEGYRRGYADGAADAASIAEVENDWRSIWDDRSPIQGEGVLATNGETVIAARWLATGWAEHGLDDVDIMDYLPEGWVTHWKPMPAAPAADTNAQGEE